ncbi:MAG: AEC family transporter [Defluviitaleaceae bacterium]|nr:AEC family transporter [Defluviitaleaceae bacterium]
MSQHLFFSVNTTMPFILLAVLGFFLKRRKIINENFVAQGNKVVFYFAIPATIFNHIYKADLSAVFDAKFLFFNVAWLVVFFIAIWLLAYKFMNDKESVASFVNSAYRSSLAVVAPPLLVLLFGAQNSHGADENILPKGILAVSVLLIFSYATASILFAVHETKTRKKISVSKKNFATTIFFNAPAIGVLIAIAKNPVVIGVVVGLIFNFFGWEFVTASGESTFASSTINALAGLAMPLAMICVGGNLAFHGFDAKFKYVIVSTMVKLLFMPICAIIFAYFFGFRGNDLAVIMILNALPMAVGAYVMQAELGGDSYIGASVLMLTMIFSAFTLTLFIFLFRAFGILI